MTEAEFRAEHAHVVETRLGILGVTPTDRPSREQLKIARKEADDWEERLRLQMWIDKQQSGVLS